MDSPILQKLWHGHTDRRNYAFSGLALFFIKFNLDRLIAGFVFSKEWLPWAYLLPGYNSRSIWSWPEDRWFALTLAASSLPFILAGLLLTRRRLVDAGWPAALALLFFVPFVNVVFFVTLCLLPSVAAAENDPKTVQPARRWRRIFTFSSGSASAAAAVAFTVVLSVPLVAFATLVLKNYGWGLFVGVPFMSGFLSAVLHGVAARRTWAQCCTVALLSVVFTAVLMLLFAVEGVLCIAMAAPLAAPLAVLGATAGYVLQADYWTRRRRQAVPLYAGAWALLPLLLTVETQTAGTPPLIGVTTQVDIAAPPAMVWRHVVTFSELPPPKELIFRSGIAYPIRATIKGDGIGAVRHCEFSTGPFVEPITVWDEPRRLAFDVVAQPHPMREISPYRAIHPPHLDGFFRSKRGQFLLVPLSNGHTRLEGTTWYEQRLWPAVYWQSWSDWLVHTIHRRVLNHIRDEAENTARTE